MLNSLIFQRDICVPCMKFAEPTTESLLAHYSNEVCTHVEASIALFFGLIGTLIIMEVVNTLAARIVFSIVYFALGVLGTYFFVRLFYYRKLLEEILSSKPYRDNHLSFQNHVFKKSKFIELTQRISRNKRSEYNLNWAWSMLTLAIIAGTLSWVIVVFSL